ncbi:TM2 domain protein [Campylobacter rectus RM3267]|uniref:TM2 domain-containing protein n=2 Tax=Campylobacter rectus TaxID=203 RepID=A0A6G5QNF1_CAMRE|nr:TM2 domain protein [Campylobacter rectus RM3267]QCD47273.1 TM2 domain-containing protein [Campylobacter rectus]
MDICSFVLLKDKVSDANLIAIKNKIEKLEADGHKIDILSVVPTLSSPNIGLAISVFLGWLGSDRIYKGDMGLSVFKLLICSMLPILAVILGAFPLAIIGLVWYFMDISLVFLGIKKDNFNKIMQALSSYKNTNVKLTDEKQVATQNFISEIKDAQAVQNFAQSKSETKESATNLNKETQSLKQELKTNISKENINLQTKFEPAASERQTTNATSNLSKLPASPKSPAIGLVLGLFLGWLGVDRFYKGDIMLGIFKILLCVAPALLFASAAKTNSDAELMVASVIMCAGLIWCFADLFLVYIGIKKRQSK